MLVDGDETTALEFTVESTEVELPAPVREGHSFEGWFDGDERVESLAAGTVGDVELQARWTANVYKLTYLDAEGEDHSIDLAYGAEYVVDGMKLTMGAADATLPAPDKAPEAGYSRNGWAVRYDPNDPTPRFEIVQGQPVVYTIVYEGVEGATVPDNPTTFTCVTDTFTIAAPTKDGFEFPWQPIVIAILVVGALLGMLLLAKRKRDREEEQLESVQTRS